MKRLRCLVNYDITSQQRCWLLKYLAEVGGRRGQRSVQLGQCPVWETCVTVWWDTGNVYVSCSSSSGLLLVWSHRSFQGARRHVFVVPPCRLVASPWIWKNGWGIWNWKIWLGFIKIILLQRTHQLFLPSLFHLLHFHHRSVKIQKGT